MSDIAKYYDKAKWESKNPILGAGQPGFENETGKVKIGDGTKRWSQLSYANVPAWTLPREPVSLGTTKEEIANADLAFKGHLDFSGASVTGLPGGAGGQPTTNAAELTSGTLNPARIADGSLPVAKVSGVLPDAQIPSSIARDTEVSTAVALVVDGAPTSLNTLGKLATSVASKATPADVSTAVAGVVDSAPTALNTLGKLATALNAKPATADVTAAKARANHTGTQTAATISDFQSAVAATPGFGGGTGAPATTSASALTSGTLDPARIANASLPMTKLTGTLADSQIPAAIARDTEVATAVNAGVTDAKARAGHTGTQTSNTISDFTTAVQAVVNAMSGGGGTTPTQPTTPAPQSGIISGLSVNGVDGVDKATLPTSSPFYTWRGGTKTIGAISTWADDGIETTKNVWALSFDGFGPFPGIMDIAIGGVYPNQGDTWAQAAAGAYDSRFVDCFNIIAQYRRGKGNTGTWVRPLHEFNGNWYPWALHSAQEIEYFKQVWVRIWNIKNNIFPEAKFHWSPNRETSGVSIKSTDAWPGNAYVDAVAPDIYFQYPAYRTQAEWDAHLTVTDATGGPKGIEAWRQFALSKGKPLCLPEWGTSSEPGVPAGPYPPYIDQPIAMTSMLNYLEAHQGSGAGEFVYANYFNAADANDAYSGRFGLYPYTESPNAAAAYKAWHSAR